MRAELRSGLDRASRLVPGSGFAELTAGVVHPWQGDTSAFLRGEVGWHLAEPLAAFAFAQADRVGIQAGIGARLSF